MAQEKPGLKSTADPHRYCLWDAPTARDLDPCWCLRGCFHKSPPATQGLCRISVQRDPPAGSPPLLSVQQSIGHSGGLWEVTQREWGPPPWIKEGPVGAPSTADSSTGQGLHLTPLSAVSEGLRGQMASSRPALRLSLSQMSYN